eukprot:11520764-Alexandrium_andersonii.AAC.1
MGRDCRSALAWTSKAIRARSRATGAPAPAQTNFDFPETNGTSQEAIWPNAERPKRPGQRPPWRFPARP